MSIITLTSDLGTTDYYVGAVKGKLLSINPNLSIVDISHEVPVFNISIGAFMLKSCYQDFPIGTIHIIGISSETNEESRHLLVKKNGHYFIGADNGLFSILFENEVDEIIEISIQKNQHLSKFSSKEIFAQVAGELSLGKPIGEFGFPSDRLNEKTTFQATTDADLIKGMVQYVDHYGNLITNITEELFENIRNDRFFEIIFRRADYNISHLSDNYSEVPDGERLAFFSHNGFLEIAINKGNASKLFGLKLNDIVRIEFKNTL